MEQETEFVKVQRSLFTTVEHCSKLFIVYSHVFDQVIFQRGLTLAAQSSP